jgi:3',5'-cyclic AMP phosphodiesterase CpdA
MRMPVYPVMGNHDEGSHYYERYFKSLRDTGGNYSFDWGRVHFVVLDFNNGIDADDENVAWLEQDLQGHQDVDFIVVCHHMPVYFSDSGDVSLPTKMQTILAPIYEQYGVKLVLSGHLHGYQHHLKNNIHYVISAGGGGKLYDVSLPLEGSTMRLCKSYNFMDCRVDGDVMTITVYDPDGNSLDAFEISKTGTPDIRSRIAVEANTAEVAPGGQFRVSVYIKNISDLGSASFSLPVYKDEPAIQVSVQDADPLSDGVQIEPGNLGGTVMLNSFDSGSGIIWYNEKLSAGVSSDNFTISSAVLKIPAGAQNTTLYFVPDFELYDGSGNAIPYFMGGIKVVIKQE